MTGKENFVYDMDRMTDEMPQGKGQAPGIITACEAEAARKCISTALEAGASQVRVALDKSISDSLSLLNGELDKVCHSADRAVSLSIFANGRYGTFSTNETDEGKLMDFVKKAVRTTGMLAEDRCRRLPDPARTAKDATDGDETGLYDRSRHMIAQDMRLSAAMSGSIFRQAKEGRIPEEMLTGNGKYSIISEECEYSDSIDDNLTLDSRGFRGRHIETSFGYTAEITVGTHDGSLFSGYWWNSSPFMSGLTIDGCSETALRRAAGQIGQEKCRSGKYNMIVDSCVSSRLVAPIVSALNAMSLQQKNSFLTDSLGRKIFAEGLTLMDLARTCGRPGSRFYDSEGVATKDCPVISGGTVMEYFINTYMSEKTGLPPTVEGISRPVLMPWAADSGLQSAEKAISLQDMFRCCKDGIYVCGFNGGNCNPTTGDFSYGVEGFVFRDGEMAGPVREMLVTGNMVTLWNSLTAAGSDARKCSRWQIPSLAFAEVDFSA